MTAGNYGSLRATDADREKVYALLQAAYADGRLTWDEFDSRSSAALAAKTYDQLAPLTTDLTKPVVISPRPYQPVYRARPQTNRLAIASLSCGVGQIMFLFPAGIAAIVCGYAARSQIRRTGEDGAGMAKAGIILGYLGVLLPILITVIAVLAGR
jgi:hypothetical protein